MKILVGYLPGTPVTGFFGMFEENYGKPEDGPLSTIVPSTEKGTILPFSCPACDKAIDFRSKKEREKFHDTRIGVSAMSGRRVKRDNYYCPYCGYRFKLNFHGNPLKTAIYGKAVAPSEVIDADGTVSRRDQMTFIGAMVDRVCRVVDVIGAGGIVQVPIRNPFQTKQLPGKSGGVAVSPAKAAILSRAMSTGDRLVSKGLRIQKKKGGKGLRFGKSVEKFGRKMIDTAHKAEAALKKQAGQGGILQGNKSKAAEMVKPLPTKPTMVAPVQMNKPVVPLVPSITRPLKRQMPAPRPKPAAPMGAARRMVMGADPYTWTDTETSGSQADVLTSQAERLQALGTIVDEISDLAVEMFDLYELLPQSAAKLISDGTTYLNFLGTLADKIDAAILGNDQATIDGFNYIQYNWNNMFKGWITAWIAQAKFTINRFGFDPNTVKGRMGPAMTSLKAAIDHATKASAAVAQINAELAQATTEEVASAQTILDEGVQNQTDQAAFNLNDWIKRATEAATKTEAAAKACDLAVANYKPEVDTNTNTNDTNTNTNDSPPGGGGGGGFGGGDSYGGDDGGGFSEDMLSEDGSVPTPPTYGGGGGFSESRTTPEIPDGFGGFIEGPSWSESADQAYESSPLEEWEQGTTMDHSEPLMPFEGAEDDSYGESEMEFPSVDENPIDATDTMDETQVTEGAEMVVGHYGRNKHWSRHLDR